MNPRMLYAMMPLSMIATISVANAITMSTVRQLRRIRCFKNTAPYLVYVHSNYFSLDIQHSLPSKLCASGDIFPTAMTKPFLVFVLN
jgi:hypothetical protein